MIGTIRHGGVVIASERAHASTFSKKWNSTITRLTKQPQLDDSRGQQEWQRQQSTTTALSYTLTKAGTSRLNKKACCQTRIYIYIHTLARSHPHARHVRNPAIHMHGQTPAYGWLMIGTIRHGGVVIASERAYASTFSENGTVR